MVRSNSSFLYLCNYPSPTILTINVFRIKDFEDIIKDLNENIFNLEETVKRVTYKSSHGIFAASSMCEVCS